MPCLLIPQEKVAQGNTAVVQAPNPTYKNMRPRDGEACGPQQRRVPDLSLLSSIKP